MSEQLAVSSEQEDAALDALLEDTERSIARRLYYDDDNPAGSFKDDDK